MGRRVLLAFVVILAGVWAWIGLRPGLEERLAELIAELGARGEPVSLAEMEPPMPRDADNGAPDLDAALAWFGANRPSDDWENRVVGPWNPLVEAPYEEHATPEQIAELQAVLVGFAPGFELVDRGADKLEIAWPRGSTDTAAAWFENRSEVRTLQQLARLLSARALSSPEGADRVRAIRSELGMGARFRARTELDHLIACSLFAAGCAALRDGLERDAIDAEAARRDLDTLLRTRWDARFPDVVRATRAGHLDLLPFWIDGTMQAEMSKRFGGQGPSALERFLEDVGRLVRGRPPREDGATPEVLLEWVRGLDRFLASGLTAEETFRIGESERLDGVANLLPRVRRKLVDADASAALARLALAACEHRRIHGDWPAAPDALQPLFPDGVPVDPFTGVPLVMERDGDDLVLRAIPWDGVVAEDDAPADLGYTWRLPPR